MKKSSLVPKMIYHKKFITTFVPECSPVTKEDISCLKSFLNSVENVLVLTGAGVSTESGVPDYRSKGIGLYERSSKKPISYQEFMKDVHRRRHYWLRNYIGWPKFSSCSPNYTHNVLCKMERNQIITHVITQNVDNLHFKAGNTRVIELHGSTYRVICVTCKFKEDRHIFQKQLEKLNPDTYLSSDMIRPDGDVEIPEDQVDSFIVPDCPNCGGILKPDVVFFGDNVPKDRTEAVKNLVQKSSSLLVLGSSLSVFSAFRIILQASELQKPIAIVNIGKTRADHLTSLKIEANCSEILSYVY